MEVESRKVLRKEGGKAKDVRKSIDNVRLQEEVSMMNDRMIREIGRMDR